VGRHNTFGVIVADYNATDYSVTLTSGTAYTQGANNLVAGRRKRYKMRAAPAVGVTPVIWVVADVEDTTGVYAPAAITGLARVVASWEA
jgi:hypothetical protein